MSAAVAITGVNAAEPGNGVYESNEIADQAIAMTADIESGKDADAIDFLTTGLKAISEPARNSQIRQGVPKNANSSGFGKICSPSDKKYKMTNEMDEIAIKITTDSCELIRIFSLFKVIKSTGKKM